MRKKPVITVICLKCNGVISACAFDEIALDKEWIDETRDYYQKGHKVEFQESGKYYWCLCGTGSDHTGK